MLQINTIREQKEDVIRRLAVKNFDANGLINNILDVDGTRRATQTELDNILAAQNNLAKQVGDLFKSGKQAEANDLKNKSSALKEESKLLSDRLNEIEKELNDLLVRLPNLPATAVPKGKTPEENETVFKSTETLPELGADALPHWELTSKYNLIDFELGVKLTGAGFPVYKGKGARLQ